MNSLTPAQENALAQFKENIHLSGNGFHELIIKLCAEYQLPFQPVRTVFMKTQSGIEREIRSGNGVPSAELLTMEHWIAKIRVQLSDLAKNTVPIMEMLTQERQYKHVQEALENPIKDDDQKRLLIAELEDLYELKICNSLKAMLRTSKLFWSVKADLFEMTESQRAKFSDYPKHMKATEHLLELADKIMPERSI